LLRLQFRTLGTEFFAARFERRSFSFELCSADIDVALESNDLGLAALDRLCPCLQSLSCFGKGVVDRVEC